MKFMESLAKLKPNSQFIKPSSMLGLRCSCTYFAWFKHDIQSEQLFWLWGVSSSSDLAFRQAGVNPLGGLKEVCKIGSSFKNSLSCFVLPFLGNQCFKQCRVFGINEMPFMWYFLFSFTCLQYLAVVYTFWVESAIMSGLGKWSLQFERG